MKNTVLILFLVFSNLIFAQVSTDPAIPTATTEITITLDTSGTELDGYTGDIYAHTGVLTSESADASDWKYVIAEWTENTEKAKLTKTAANTYQLKITPNIPTFYNITGGDTVTDIAVVFRSSDGSKQTRPDIFIKIYEEGLNITFTNPSNNSVLSLNDNITISAEASIDADLELFFDGTSLKTEIASKTISTTYTLTTAGYHTLKATASANSENKDSEIKIFVKSPTQVSDKPSGLKYGLNKNTDNSVTFLFKAPLKNDVFVIGDFNSWKLDTNHQMFKDSNGEDFWLTISGLDTTKEYAYQYVIDDGLIVADPYSEKVLDPWNDKYIPESTYPNLKPYPTDFTTGIVSTFQIQEDDYTWSVTDFQKPDQDNLIVYELLIRDFTIVGTDDIGDFKTAITKLDYLKSLGINAIELMPINEFEGNDSWGYNPSFHNALDKAYGTKNDFKNFVDQCHEKGIAVILDVVYNHAFGQSPLSQMYWNSSTSKPANNSPWLNVDATHPYNVGNDFNHESDYTKTYVKQTLEHWVNEFKIDGFRFDLSKGFTQTNNPDNVSAWGQYDASRIAIIKDYGDTLWANTSNDLYLILEHFADNSEEKELSENGFMLWGNSNHNYNQNTKGYSSESSIDWMSYKTRTWASPKVVGYMESHDEERLMYNNLQSGRANDNYNIKDLNTALSREETAGVFLFTIPGPKMIWQFGELGYDISIDENGRTGRKPVIWSYEDNVNRKHIYNTWATLIEFKKKYPEVFNTTDFSLNVGNTSTKSIVLKDASFDVVIIGNFDIVDNDVSTPFTKTGTWYEYFTGEEKDVTATSENITLKPGEYKMYATVRLLDPRGGTSGDDSDNDGVVDTEDLCPNTMEGIAVNSTGCPIFSLASDNFEIQSVSETCPDTENGQIVIVASEELNYTTTIDGKEYHFTSNLTTDDLAPGDYTFCISVDGQSYEQCYEVTIDPGSSLIGKAELQTNKVAVAIEQGTAPFEVMINGKQVYKTLESSFSIDVTQGDLVEIKTAIACEGVLSKNIDMLEGIAIYPNPTAGAFEISIPFMLKEVTIELYNIQSQLISSKLYPVRYGKVQLNIENNPKGLYLARIITDNPITLKIIKQ